MINRGGEGWINYREKATSKLVW